MIQRVVKEEKDEFFAFMLSVHGARTSVEIVKKATTPALDQAAKLLTRLVDLDHDGYVTRRDVLTTLAFPAALLVMDLGSDRDAETARKAGGDVFAKYLLDDAARAEVRNIDSRKVDKAFVDNLVGIKALFAAIDQSNSGMLSVEEISRTLLPMRACPTPNPPVVYLTR